MIRAIFWKEWHEHRSKYLGYWLTLNAPTLLLAIGIAFSRFARIPFADLSDGTAMKYLPLALLQPLLVATLFLLLTSYLAVATFSPEMDDRSLFFMYEQPVSRKVFLAVKFLYGACHVVCATSFAILLMPSAAYIMMLISGKVTAAGSVAAFSVVMGAAGRSAVWCSLISLAGFSVSALISAVVPRWWLAAIVSVTLTFGLIYEGSDFFGFFPDFDAGQISVGMSFSSNDSPWITISRIVTPQEIKAFAHWKLWPLLTAALLILAFCSATTLLYSRKELK
jgi:hypothetical protein